MKVGDLVTVGPRHVGAAKPFVSIVLAVCTPEMHRNGMHLVSHTVHYNERHNRAPECTTPEAKHLPPARTAATTSASGGGSNHGGNDGDVDGGTDGGTTAAVGAATPSAAAALLVFKVPLIGRFK